MMNNDLQWNLTDSVVKDDLSEAQKYLETRVTRVDPNKEELYFKSSRPSIFWSKSPEMIALLTKYGADPNLLIENRTMTPLINMVCNKSPNLVKALLDRGADPNKRTVDGQTPLHYVAEAWSIRYLAERGADLKAENTLPLRTTPLMAAALADQIDGVKVLIECGADINHTNSLERSVLFYVCSPEMVRLLLDQGIAGDKFFEHDKYGDIPVVSVLSSYAKSSPDYYPHRRSDETYPVALAMLKEMVKHKVRTDKEIEKYWDFNAPVGEKGDIFQYYENKREARKARKELETLQRTIFADQTAFEYDYNGFER